MLKLDGKGCDEITLRSSTTLLFALVAPEPVIHPEQPDTFSEAVMAGGSCYAPSKYFSPKVGPDGQYHTRLLVESKRKPVGTTFFAAFAKSVNFPCLFFPA